MTLEVQEADGNLMQRDSILESQVMLPELSYRHPKKWDSLLSAPGASVVLPLKGISVHCLLESSEGCPELQEALAQKGGWCKPVLLQSV